MFVVQNSSHPLNRGPCLEQFCNWNFKFHHLKLVTSLHKNKYHQCFSWTSSGLWTPSGHPLDILGTLYGQLLDTFLTPSGHLLDTLWTCPDVQRVSKRCPEDVQRVSRGRPEDAFRTSFNFECWNLIFCLQNCSTFGVQSHLAVCNCPFILPLLSNHNFTFVLCNEFCCNFNYFLCESPEGYYYIVIYY